MQTTLLRPTDQMAPRRARIGRGIYLATSDASWRQRVGRFVRRHPLITFLVVFNTFGQAVAFVPVIARSVYSIELDTDLILIVPTLFFLLLPALIITRISRGREGLRALLRSMVRIQIQWWWYLLPLLVMPAITLASTLSVPPNGLNARDLVIAYLTAYLPALLFQFVTTNWWEETAWMGFVQAPLQQRFGPWRAVLLTAPFFSLAHVSAMFDGTFTQVLVKFLLLAVLVIPSAAGLALQQDGQHRPRGSGPRSIECIRFWPGAGALPPDRGWGPSFPTHSHRCHRLLSWPPRRTPPNGQPSGSSGNGSPALP
jgi:membrane protease YdiL (CAAX protease family)